MLFAVIFAAVALGLSAFALFVSITTRGQVRRDAHRHTPPRRPAAESPLGFVDEREENLGPPREVGERRRTDLGPAARHRAPDDERARRRDADDPQWRTAPREPATEQIVAQRPRVPDTGDLPATAEHPAPRQLPRRPGGAPLPPPGAIGRDR